ncbi:MAG: rhodanese-like domain-containing protein [Puniceicoccaceae bacterium]
MKLLKLTFAVIGLAIFTSSAVAGDYPDLSVDELHQAIEANEVVVLDANGSKRYASGHIPGAIDFASTKDLSSVLPEDKGTLIVAYCGGPRCSAFKKAAKAAEKLGYTNVKHLSAGISGWKDAGKPVEKVN